MSQESAPFLDTSFHIHWSRLVPEAVVSDVTKALQQAQAQIDALADGWNPEDENCCRCGY